jgi:hypothetical protein
MGFLLLGLDSLIACLAVGSIVGSRARWPLAALFGIADGAGFLVGANFSVHLSDGLSDKLQTGILLALGAYLIGIAVLAMRTQRAASSWPIWVLPFVLSIDNLTFGLVGGHSTGALFAQAGEQALSSALLAGVGLAVGLVLPRVVPALRRRATATGISGGALMLASGALLLVG